MAGTVALGHGTIVPRVSTLLGGQARRFQVQSSDPAPVAWTWLVQDPDGGSIDPATGNFTAAPVTDPRSVRIRATAQDSPQRILEATVLVLPYQPFDLVTKVLGTDWLDPYGTDLPFWNPDTGERMPSTAQVTRTVRRSRTLPVVLAGAGLPIRLAWEAGPRGAAQLLTTWEGATQIRRDVTGLSALTLTGRSPGKDYVLEILEPQADEPTRWSSYIFSGQIHTRGLMPFAGHPDREPEHQDGSGSSARFHQPFGLAKVIEHGAPCYLLSDPVSHVIRRLSPDGRVVTVWGLPGQRGHADNQPPARQSWLAALYRQDNVTEPALFNQPTYLEVSGPRGLHRPPWQSCHVADSGNHVIRTLKPDGKVETLAGIPNQAGHRDGDLAPFTLFNNPQGLAEDPEGNLFVADQGNAVIRRLDRAGRVRTLAGAPGERGSADGVGEAARFRELRGLVLHGTVEGPWALFAADGHGIRHISLPDGVVTTVLGQVDEPGCADVQGGRREGREQALLRPCLCRPCGLASTRNGLMIADQGNHSLRFWSQGEASLATVAGDPALGETRFGLLRDGMAGPLEEGYAALESPRTLVQAGASPERFLVSAGTCVAELVPCMGGRTALKASLRPGMVVPLGGSCVVRIVLGPEPVGHGSPLPADLSVVVWVDFLEPDGTLADRRRGEGSSAFPVVVEGTFSQRGQGLVVLRGVSSQGVSFEDRASVEIQ